MKEPKTVKTWDELPPIVFDGDAAYSTRYLERKYRLMEDALAGFLIRCDEGEAHHKRTYKHFRELLDK